MQYRVEHGIPVFVPNPTNYYGEFPREKMHKLLAGDISDLDQSLANLLRAQKAERRLGEYIMGAGRAGWKFLLPVSDKSVVLDLGCGWGGISHNLSLNAKQVITIDSTMDDVQINADGSVDIYVGPEAPAGKEANWLQTDPERRFFLLSRFYGPEPGLYDGSFVLNDIERIE